MKHLCSLLFFVILFANFLSAQTRMQSAQDIDNLIDDVDSKYSDQVVSSEYEIYFKKDEDRKNFKKLREFLKEKENLYDALKNEKINHWDESSSISSIESKIGQLNELIKNKKDTDSMTSPYSLLFPYNNRYSDFESSRPPVSLVVSDVKQKIQDFKTRIEFVKKDTSILNYLNKNIEIVRNDIYRVRNQIDSALAPEYKQQDFRITISICFTVLIGILLVVFFYIVYKKSDNTLSKDLLSGNGLQFITLFVLIIAVILFGILSILQSSELSAILSGISGYILGKGTQKDLSTIFTTTTSQMASQQPIGVLSKVQQSGGTPPARTPSTDTGISSSNRLNTSGDETETFDNRSALNQLEFGDADSEDELNQPRD